MSAIIGKIELILPLLLALTLSARGAQISGNIKSTSGEPLASASVVLEGTALGAATDLDGEYRIYNVPGDVYSLTASMVGYKDSTLAEVVVYEDTDLELNFVLRTEVIQLQEAVVAGTARKGSEKRELEERFKAAAITEALVGDVIKRMPDPNVSQLVRRVTGVSTEGGDPIIRGLGVRYSKVTLNSSQIAGTEPNKSGVSLELFPSNLINQITVSKTYLPDHNGEFAGGIIDMSTWEVPEGSHASLSLSGGYNPTTTFGNFLTYQGGKYDFAGFDDGSRALPDPVENAGTVIRLRGRFTPEGFPADSLIALAKSFPNRWKTSSKTAAPNQSLSGSLSHRFNVLGRPLGLMATGLYKHSQKSLASSRNIYKGGESGRVELQHYYTMDSYTESVVSGALLAAKYDFTPLHSLTLSSMFNRDTDDETRFYEGRNSDRDKLIKDTRMRFVEQGVSTTQLSARHLFPALDAAALDWQLTASHGFRHEPDSREVQYEKSDDDTVYLMANDPQSGSRIFSELKDESRSAALDWTQPLRSNLNVKAGGALQRRSRDAETRFFRFELRPNYIVDVTAAPEAIFDTSNIHMQGILLREATRPTDSYSASHDVNAAFLMGDYQMLPKVRLVGGVRFEHSVQEVTSYELFTVSQEPVVGRIATDDLLPGANLIYSIDETRNLRLAASRTVSRPDFREMSEFEFTDIIGGHAVIGNSSLKRASINNYDLRYEQRYGGANLFSISVFYKRFIDPIEVVIQPTAQHRVSYENARSADNSGLELEMRQNLGDLHPALSEWSASWNLTLLESNIQLSDSTRGIQTSSRRPLHGQSPYLFNGSLRYTSLCWGTQADLVLHTFGKRIVEVGSKPLPDVYELPHPDLDFGIAQPLGRQFKVKAAVENLLNPTVEFRQGGEITESYREGVSYSLGITWMI